MRDEGLSGIGFGLGEGESEADAAETQRLDGDATAAPSTNTRLALAKRIALGAAIVVGVVALVVSLMLLRPPQTLEQRQPDRTRLSVPVERRALVSTVVTRGTATSAGEVPVSCHPALAGADTQVFTRPAEPGATLNEGAVLAALNGRPVLLLKGETPAFRTMLPGTSGVDVTQLQDGLKRLGHRITDEAGVLGASTQQAIVRWYGDAGFTANVPAPDAAAGLRAARDAVTMAEAQLASARRALQKAQAGPPRSAVLAAQHAVQQARDTVGAAATDAERTTANRQLEVALAQEKELRAVDVDDQRAAVTTAEKLLARAKEDYAALAATTGVSVPFCEVIFVPELPVRVTQAAASANRQAGGESSDAAGSASSDSWATVAPGDLLLRGSLSAAEGALVSVGAAVTFRADGATQDRIGTVAKVYSENGQSRVDIAPEEALGSDAQGQSFRVAIEVGSTDGDVLVVPVGAVVGSAGGLARVQKADGQRTVEVEVRAGLVADGYLEIVPVDPGLLTEGDEVVVSS